MSTLETRLKKLKTDRESYGTGKGTTFSKSFRKAVVQYHYDSGISVENMAKSLNIHYTTVHKWKRLLGTGQTHMKHGKTTRADLKTKALAVTDELDNGMSTIAIANKYNITRQQYGSWKASVQGRYEEFRELPDGIMYVAKPEKLIFGDANIRAYRDLMKVQLEIREKLLSDMHKYGYGAKELEDEVNLLKVAITTAEKLKDIK